MSNSNVVLWGHKKSEPSWMEVIITDKPEHIENAKVWAEKNGYVTRISKINLSEKPDFKKCIG